MTSAKAPGDGAKNAVVKVGGGRGSVVRGGHDRYIITAGHCLPSMPPCIGASHDYERTYRKLVGPLGESKPTIWAECLFVDPVSDLAVLGGPDNQSLSKEADAYAALTESVRPLRVGGAPSKAVVYVLTLDRRWIGCVATHVGGPLWLDALPESIEGGMSGSPIVDSTGAALGVVCLDGGSLSPRLTYHLPSGLLAKLAKARPRRADPTPVS